MTSWTEQRLELASAHVHDLRRPDIHGSRMPEALSAAHVSRFGDWAFATADLDGRALAHWLQPPAGRPVAIIEPAVGEHYSAASIAALLDPDWEPSSAPGARSTDLLPRWGRIRKAHRIAVSIAPSRFRPSGRGFSNDVVAMRAALAWAAFTDDAEALWRAHGVDRGVRAEQFACAGMTALEAAPWYNARILPKPARRFAAAGWRPQVAALLGALPAPAEWDEDDDAEAFVEAWVATGLPDIHAVLASFCGLAPDDVSGHVNVAALQRAAASRTDLTDDEADVVPVHPRPDAARARLS